MILSKETTTGVEFYLKQTIREFNLWIKEYNLLVKEKKRNR